MPGSGIEESASETDAMPSANLFVVVGMLLNSGLDESPTIKTPSHEIVGSSGFVHAVGSWLDSKTGKRVGDVLRDQDHLREPFTASIWCERDVKRCTMAEVYSANGTLQISRILFSVKAWSEREIRAFYTDGCIGITLSVREPENSATLKREVYEKCRTNPAWSATELTLVDGTGR